MLAKVLMPKNVHVMRYLSYLQWKLNLETSLLHRQWKESSGNNLSSLHCKCVQSAYKRKYGLWKKLCRPRSFYSIVRLWSFLGNAFYMYFVRKNFDVLLWLKRLATTPTLGCSMTLLHLPCYLWPKISGEFWH